MDIEGRVWKKAAQVFGPRLQNMVDEGIASFKCRPGFDDPTRVHAALIGVPAFESLQGALKAHSRAEGAWGGQGFIVVRLHLRTHLRRHLQWPLMQTPDWSDEIGDSYFAGDRGL